MRALIIYRVDIANISNRGVSKKMQGHVYGLTQNGFEVDVIYISGGGLYLNDKKIAEFASNLISEGLFKARGFYQAVMKNVNVEKYDLVLIRFHLVMDGFVSMLKFFQGRKIIIDLPTYPYEKEWRGLKGKLLLKIDERNRRKLKDTVDLIMHYGQDRALFGIPCLNVSNGILPILGPSVENVKKGKSLQLLAVGKWAYWHGLDRIIKGMDSEEDAALHIVGEGSEAESLKEMAKGKSNIIFHGNLSGKALDELSGRADIGIGTLGIHRKGLKIDSSLKHREYCMRGLPFILSTNDLDFPEGLEFVKYFEVSDNVVDLHEIKMFHGSIQDKIDIEKKMREYGKMNLGWERKMKEVVEAIGFT